MIDIVGRITPITIADRQTPSTMVPLKKPTKPPKIAPPPAPINANIVVTMRASDALDQYECKQEFCTTIQPPP